MARYDKFCSILKRNYNICTSEIKLVNETRYSFDMQPVRQMIVDSNCSELKNKDEYDCMNECLQEIDDSVDNIVACFEKIGYRLIPQKPERKKYLLLEDAQNKLELEIFDDPTADIYYIKRAHTYEDSDLYTPTFSYLLTKEEFKLVDRVLRLWKAGV